MWLWVGQQASAACAGSRGGSNGLVATVLITQCCSVTFSWMVNLAAIPSSRHMGLLIAVHDMFILTAASLFHEKSFSFDKNCFEGHKKLKLFSYWFSMIQALETQHAISLIKAALHARHLMELPVWKG